MVGKAQAGMPPIQIRQQGASPDAGGIDRPVPPGGSSIIACMSGHARGRQTPPKP